MHAKTIASALILGLSGAALAQVAAPGDPKLGNAANGNTAAGNDTAASTGNTAEPAGNTAAADPGKP